MIRRTTDRGVSITEDLGIRLDKPHSRSGAQFRPTHITETLEQTDQGRAVYTVEVYGPVQTKAGKDSQASAGRVTFAHTGGFGRLALADLPRRLSGYLVGPEVLAKGIALPRDGAR